MFWTRSPSLWVTSFWVELARTLVLWISSFASSRVLKSWIWIELILYVDQRLEYWKYQNNLCQEQHIQQSHLKHFITSNINFIAPSQGTCWNKNGLQAIDPMSLVHIQLLSIVSEKILLTSLTRPCLCLPENTCSRCAGSSRRCPTSCECTGWSDEPAGTCLLAKYPV